MSTRSGFAGGRCGEARTRRSATHNVTTRGPPSVPSSCASQPRRLGAPPPAIRWERRAAVDRRATALGPGAELQRKRGCATWRGARSPAEVLALRGGDRWGGAIQGSFGTPVAPPLPQDFPAAYSSSTQAGPAHPPVLMERGGKRLRASGRRRRAGLSRLCDVVWRDVDGEQGAARACWSADGSKESRRGSARGAQRERCASLRGEREGEEGGARAARRAPPRASHRGEGEERSAAMAGGGASRRPSRGSSAAVAAERAAARHRGGRARRGRSGGRARCCERARRVTRAIITPLSPAWRGHRPLLGRGGPGARAPGAYDPPGQARWPGARGGVRVPRERGARVARRARPASRGWLRSRRTAWWARTPRPSVCCLEGRERRARRVRPLSLSLLVFVGARESSRGMPTRAPAALLRVRLRSSRTTACGRRRGVCSPLSLRLSPVPRLSHHVNTYSHTVTSNKS